MTHLTEADRAIAVEIVAAWYGGHEFSKREAERAVEGLAPFASAMLAVARRLISAEMAEKPFDADSLCGIVKEAMYGAEAAGNPRPKAIVKAIRSHVAGITPFVMRD